MYQFFLLNRVITPPNPRNRAPGSISFFEAPPHAEGWHDIPRQGARLQEMEVGSVPLDYGPDLANMTLKLSFAGVPEVAMKAWEAEYLDRTNIDELYTLQDHRGKIYTVKWKSFSATCVGTLSQDDVMYWLDWYAKWYTLDQLDPTHADIADMYQVTMEFFVIPDSIFPDPYMGS